MTNLPKNTGDVAGGDLTHRGSPTEPVCKHLLAACRLNERPRTIEQLKHARKTCAPQRFPPPNVTPGAPRTPTHLKHEKHRATNVVGSMRGIAPKHGDQASPTKCFMRSYSNVYSPRSGAKCETTITKTVKSSRPPSN